MSEVTKLESSLIGNLSDTSESISGSVTIPKKYPSYSGDLEVDPKAFESVTPSKNQQVVSPDTGYNYLSQVIVNAIPYTETENAAGGITVTIEG